MFFYFCDHRNSGSLEARIPPVDAVDKQYLRQENVPENTVFILVIVI
jgi:hypothetical protein